MTAPAAKCDWANCHADMLKRVDGYNFCGRHLRSHRNQFPKAPRPVSQLKPCGTEAAYSRHIRNNEDPCEPCMAAHKEFNDTRRARRAKEQEATGYTGAEAARLVGITYRQLDFWCTAGILGPGLQVKPGTGRDRQISHEMLGHLHRIAALVRLGLAPSRAAALVNYATVTEDGFVIDRGDVVITVRGAA